jgi:geranylgeranyl pyrophosphate synthase
MAIPLLQNGCANTTVDLDWVWDAVVLTSQDRTRCLNLDAIKREVRSWFTEDSLNRIIGFPEGETERIAREWLSRDGKRWRPYLTVCAHMALRDHAPDEPARIPSDLKKLAVAVECFHKASLVHDDIEDDDKKRYGASTVHVQHGVPVALNVGDFLPGEGYRLIGELDVDPPTKIDMLRMAADGHLTLSRGQGAELCWSRRPRVLSSLDVLDIFRQKTAPAFEVALCLGAFYADAGSEVHDVLSRYSESLGIAYQIRDDLEDFSGRSDSNDLSDMRPSVVLAIAHRRAATRAETELVASLWNHECPFDDVRADVLRIIGDRGVIETATELMQAYTQQAIRSLRTLKNPTLKGLLRRVIFKIFGDDLLEGYYSESTSRNAGGGGAGIEPTT